MICIAFETIMFEIETMKRKSLKKLGKYGSLISKIQFPADFTGKRKSHLPGIPEEIPGNIP
jgi:hypothetical protein